MLVLEFELLTGRFVATAATSRSESEWPPHPARVFSALVEAWATADDDDPAGKAAAVLDRIAAADPPAIDASEASTRDVVSVYVPVNDLSVVDDCGKQEQALADAEQRLAELRAEGDLKAERKAAKEVEKLAVRLEDARRSARAAPAKLADDAIKRARSLVPETRTAKQPRSFPSVTPDRATVRYAYGDLTLDADDLANLEAVLRRVVRIGHSSSLVVARLGVDASPNLLPSAEGRLALRCPQPGQRELLVAAHERHRGLEPRVLPSRVVRYGPRELVMDVPRPRSHFGNDWLLLRRVGGVKLPGTATAGVARQLRRVLQRFADDPVPAQLSGHRADGRPMEGPHVAVVPLPFVGHRHASGLLLGVALVLPDGIEDADRAAVYRALARWEDDVRRHDPEQDVEAPRLPLHLGRAGVLELERCEFGALPATLRPGTWTGPATAYRTVTPIALDRNPGDLRSRNPAALATALANARETIATACEHIGLPQPTAVEIWPAAPLVGAEKARRFPRFPGTGRSPDRVLTHARICFAEPVEGPVLLGAGRYHGLGLCRPERDDD